MISSIYTAQNNGIMSDVWRLLSNFYAAVAFSCNILLIYLILNNTLLHKNLDIIVISYTKNGGYDFLLNMTVYLIIPIMLINYLKVYKNKKDKALIREYKNSYRKAPFVIYFMISFLGPIIYVISRVEIRF